MYLCQTLISYQSGRGSLILLNLLPSLSLPADRPGRAIEGPSAAYLRGQEGSLGDAFYKRRVLGWVQYYFALSPVKKVLYQFQTELVWKYELIHITFS